MDVNEQTGVSGFILPQHRVDLILNKSSTVPGGSTSETIMQDVLVLASGQTLTRTEDKSMVVRTVTLEVSPEEADELVSARARGTLSLSLRGMDDHARVARPEPKPDTRSILVAAVEIAPGQAIAPEMVRLQEVPKEQAPEGALAEPARALGRKPITMLAVGQPITEAALAPPKAEPKKAKSRDLASRVGPGMRPFFLLEEEYASLTGHLQERSRVDVLFVKKEKPDRLAFPGAPTAGAAVPPAPLGAPLPEYEPILQDARVFLPAATEGDGEDAEDAPVADGPVALEVSVVDAMRLTAARAGGGLALVLRGPEDRGRWVPERRSVAVIRGPSGKGSGLELLTPTPGTGLYDHSGGLPTPTASRPSGLRRPR